MKKTKTVASTVVGSRATQAKIDEHVVAVRKMPWHAIAISDN